MYTYIVQLYSNIYCFCILTLMCIQIVRQVLSMRKYYLLVQYSSIITLYYLVIYSLKDKKSFI